MLGVAGGNTPTSADLPLFFAAALIAPVRIRAGSGDLIDEASTGPTRCLASNRYRISETTIESTC
jgi:hypothetical protein